MADYTFTINGERRRVEDVPEWLPMLWVLRDKLGITGPKYGCGIGACRACTCHIEDGDGGFAEFQPCIARADEIGDRRIRTIEGLADGDDLHPVQDAWLELDVPQCGFCQPVQIMTATALLARNGGQVTDQQIDQIENVCRCGTYARIRQAIKHAASTMDGFDDDFGTDSGTPDAEVADEPDTSSDAPVDPDDDTSGPLDDLGDTLDDGGGGPGDVLDGDGDPSTGSGTDERDGNGLLGGLLGRR